MTDSSHRDAGATIVMCGPLRASASGRRRAAGQAPDRRRRAAAPTASATSARFPAALANVLLRTRAVRAVVARL